MLESVSNTLEYESSCLYYDMFNYRVMAHALMQWPITMFPILLSIIYISCDPLKFYAVAQLCYLMPLLVVIVELTWSESKAGGRSVK